MDITKKKWLFFARIFCALYLVANSEYHENGNHILTIKQASTNGHLEIVKFLYKNRKKLDCDPNIKPNPVLVSACEKGHLKIVKWVVEQTKCNLLENEEECCTLASTNHHLHIMKYLYDNFVDSFSHLFMITVDVKLWQKKTIPPKSSIPLSSNLRVIFKI